MDFKRLDKRYEKIKQGLLEAEEAIKARIESEKQQNEEKTAKVMFDEIQKTMQLESNHKNFNEELIFLTTELMEMSMKDLKENFMKQNETKSTVQ